MNLTVYLYAIFLIAVKGIKGFKYPSFLAAILMWKKYVLKVIASLQELVFQAPLSALLSVAKQMSAMPSSFRPSTVHAQDARN
ncbi:hypothetical protein DPMN_121117 [Dreissena polymorpha]|uniref:Uncharacterized protein n=1 Tax=Dreissena polymorpha TaxID=45954 RepID=A0A9D4GLJ4_DREPO|nr:hypothetical protein DPMN_121117 [Dreissena polymorpha]